MKGNKQSCKRGDNRFN